MNVNVPVPAGEQTDRDAGAGARILVVDDVADNRDILSRRLIRRGFEVFEAENGTEALRKIAEADFDLVLLDIMMPDILGTEVVREVRKTRTASELPIIMVSAKSEGGDVAESLELGANDYILKPVDFTAAMARIRTQLASSAKSARKDRILEQETQSRRRSEDQLRYMAYHDALTGMANRSALLEDLEHALDGPDRDDLGLIFVDLDRFKAINDVHGHAIGDKVLCEVARRLEAEAARRSICVARLGGDEFAVLFRAAGTWTGEAIGRRIIEALFRPIMIGRLQTQVGASCGVAYASISGPEAASLIKAADFAMYRAKTTGRGRVVTFESSILEEQRRRSFLEVSMVGAVARGEFQVFYQPLICARRNRVVSFEALARWIHPWRGMIPPAEFIPVAEDTGIINEIGMWILETACRDAMQWPDDMRVAVNLSPVQFRQPELVANITRIIETTGIAPQRLEVEITEACLLEAGNNNTDILGMIRDLGVRIAIDDFGTGYSSISYLQKFVFDKLKIDKRFVDHIEDDPKAAAIVDAIVQMSHKIGISTTVEGIESRSQMISVISHGCHELQGYLFAAPMPIEKALAFIASYPDED